MALLREITLDGLFGLYDHHLDLRVDPPVTIVAGPNGIGKTTLLRLTTALLHGAYQDLAKPSFTNIRVVADSGVALSATPGERDPETGDARVLTLRLERPNRGPLTTTIALPMGPESLPPYMWMVHPNLYVDTRDDEELTAAEVSERYAVDLEQTVGPDWFDSADWLTDFIETRRLDVLQATPPRGLLRGPRRPRRAPIYDYLDAVGRELERARLELAHPLRRPKRSPRRGSHIRDRRRAWRRARLLHACRRPTPAPGCHGDSAQGPVSPLSDSHGPAGPTRR